jgi:hypothetical protein
MDLIIKIILVILTLFLLQKVFNKYEKYTDIELLGRCGPDYNNQVCPDDNPCCNKNGLCGSGENFCSSKKNMPDFNYKK